MKTKLLSFVLMFATIVGNAQQDAQFTQYMYNTVNINPAYAGSRGVMSVFGLYRNQWAGIEGAPVTSSFSVNAPTKNRHLGAGISFINDKIGPTNENTLSADLSYTIQTSAKFKLSFGIKGTANIFNLDINKLNPENQEDIQFQNLDNVFKPNIGAGVYYHSDNAYIGFSIPNFIETNRYDDNDVAIYQDKINYYLMAGYVIDLSHDIKFKPATLFKMAGGAPLQADVSANFMFIEKFTIGVAYRWSATLSAMAGFQITDELYIGYAYDREASTLNKYNSGSHEIFLRFDLLKNKGKTTDRRFF